MKKKDKKTHRFQNMDIPFNYTLNSKLINQNDKKKLYKTTLGT